MCSQSMGFACIHLVAFLALLDRHIMTNLFSKYYRTSTRNRIEIFSLLNLFQSMWFRDKSKKVFMCCPLKGIFVTGTCHIFFSTNYNFLYHANNLWCVAWHKGSTFVQIRTSFVVDYIV